MRDVIVAGGSAGSIKPLQTIVRGLPPGFPASLAVVVHIRPTRSFLASVLNKSGRLPALQPIDHEQLARGKIYVAAADHHLLLEKDRVRVIRGPLENGHRPAIDPLFRSAAEVYGPRVIAVQLSGGDSDGTAGMIAVKNAGGATIVQDPADAEFPAMTLSTLRHTVPDHVLPASEIGPLLQRLVQEEPAPMATSANGEGMPEAERDLTEFRRAAAERQPPSPYTCPDCGGTLWEEDEAGFPRYRCRVGHAYSQGDLLAEKNGDVERALWVAVRALEEKSSLIRKLRDQAMYKGREHSARFYAERADEIEQPLSTLRDLIHDERLFRLPGVSGESEP